MDRNQFIIATAVALFTAFILGWFASWLIHRLTRATSAELAELGRLAIDGGEGNVVQAGHRRELGRGGRTGR